MAEYPVMAGRHQQVHREYRAPWENVLARVVQFVIGVIVTFIALRFVLLLFGANSAAGFVQLVYAVSDIFMAPFVTIFRTQRVNGSTFEWSALVAIAVYALIGWGLLALIRALTPREYVEDVEEVRESDVHVDHTV